MENDTDSVMTHDLLWDLKWYEVHDIVQVQATKTRDDCTTYATPAGLFYRSNSTLPS